MTIAVPEPALPSGPPRPSMRDAIPSFALALGGGVAAFLLMAHDGHLRLGVPLGGLCIAACTCGVLGVVRALAPVDDAPAESIDARVLARPLALMVLTMAGFGAALWGGAHGVLPPILAGVLVAVAFVAAVAALFDVLLTLCPTMRGPGARPLLRRHGFWLIAILSAIEFPALGWGSLWDPWETHYGEVAREILSRDDWISTWWSWQGFFYSKPVLGQWMQAIAMATFGLHVQPGRMLEGFSAGTAHPEWVVRAPVTLFAIVGAYLLYKGVMRTCGRRAALLGAIALGTCPQWLFLSHQTMTDMPFVAPMCACVGLLLVGKADDDDRIARDVAVRVGRHTICMSLWHVVVGAVLLVAIPQILYLASRNLELVVHAQGAHGFRAHLDEVLVGSGGGNCTLPGNPPCATIAPVSHFEPWTQALAWTGLLGALVVMVARERRAKRLMYLAAWLMAALATMAKGPAGLALPALAALVWVAATGNWRELAKLEIGRGALLVTLLSLPWFVAMLVRHGSAFTDELIFHDMWNRALGHVHDTNEGVDTSVRYYIGQLGYGIFPWTAFLPLGLLACLRAKDAEDPHSARVLLGAWALVVFTLFSLMGTKFHHYIFPAVPPIAMLIGIGLDRAMTLSKPDAHTRAMVGAAAFGGAVLTLLVLRDLASSPLGSDQPGPIRLLQLFTYQYGRGWPASLDLHRPILAFGILATVAALAFALPRARSIAAAGFTAVAIVWGAWLLDSYMPTLSVHWGQRGIVETYVEKRGSDAEPLVAFQLNWKGESFYSGNQLAQFGTPATFGPTVASWVGQERAKGTRVVWVVTEHNRVASLKRDLGAHNFASITSKEDNNQFVLVRAEL